MTGYDPTTDVFLILGGLAVLCLWGGIMHWIERRRDRS